MWHRTKIKMALIFDTKMIYRRKHGKIKIYIFMKSLQHITKNQRNPSVINCRSMYKIIVIQKGKVENKLVFSL